MSKLFILTGFILCSGIAFSQNTEIKKKSSVKQEHNNITDSLNSIPAVKVEFPNRNEEEETNDPTNTGSTKHIINGKEVYIKEQETNGIKTTIIQEPN